MPWSTRAQVAIFSSCIEDPSWDPWGFNCSTQCPGSNSSKVYNTNAGKSIILFSSVYFFVNNSWISFLFLVLQSWNTYLETSSTSFLFPSECSNISTRRFITPRRSPRTPIATIEGRSRSRKKWPRRRKRQQAIRLIYDNILLTIRTVFVNDLTKKFKKSSFRFEMHQLNHEKWSKIAMISTCAIILRPLT